MKDMILIKNNKNKNEIITLSVACSETCYFMRYTSQPSEYFTNVIAFVMCLLSNE